MAKKSLTEQQVLDMLDIPDFRHMSKDKIMKFTSALPYMDPSVAVAALQQFPEFAKTSIEIVNCYKQSVSEALGRNADSMQSFYDSCDVLIDALKTQLDKQDLSFSEKNQIIAHMMQVLQMKAEKDSENKKFIWGAIGAISITVAAIVATAAAAIGTNSDSSGPELSAR